MRLHQHIVASGLVSSAVYGATRSPTIAIACFFTGFLVDADHLLDYWMSYPLSLNPEFAIGRGIRRTMRDFFFRKKLNRSQRYAFAFFVEKASALFASVLAPIAKSGFNLPHFFKTCEEYRLVKVYLWFHSLELLPILALAAWLTRSPAMAGFTIGLAQPLLFDHLGNYIYPKSYFILYRWKMGFVNEKVFDVPEEFRHGHGS